MLQRSFEMIERQEAIEIARKYFREFDDSLTVAGAFENDSMWIFFAENLKQVAYVTHGISVDKQTGKISNFYMPSRESFQILESSKRVELRDALDA